MFLDDKNETSAGGTVNRKLFNKKSRSAMSGQGQTEWLGSITRRGCLRQAEVPACPNHRQRQCNTLVLSHNRRQLHHHRRCHNHLLHSVKPPPPQLPDLHLTRVFHWYIRLYWYILFHNSRSNVVQLSPVTELVRRRRYRRRPCSNPCTLTNGFRRANTASWAYCISCPGACAGATLLYLLFDGRRKRRS